MGAIVITTLVKVAIFNKHSKMHNNILSDVEADESHYKMGSLIGSIDPWPSLYCVQMFNETINIF